tara:strand:+ start:169 stop:417 length:249 start_codon:yes stop_codon:yes gene_type:complete
MKNKKGQGLSLNTIIIAAIALLVLVVLVMIFTGRMSVFTGGVSGCVNQGGNCETGSSSSCPTNSIEITAKCNNNNKCCVSRP